MGAKDGEMPPYMDSKLPDWEGSYYCSFSTEESLLVITGFYDASALLSPGGTTVGDCHTLGVPKHSGARRRKARSVYFYDVDNRRRTRILRAELSRHGGEHSCFFMASESISGWGAPYLFEGSAPAPKATEGGLGRRLVVGEGGGGGVGGYT